MSNDDKIREFIPALGSKRLDRFYDPVIQITMRERLFKAALVRQAALGPGHRVLDVGCGTGTLALMIKQAQPGAKVVGLDIDTDMLAQAQAKAAAAGADITFNEGSATDLPYGDSSFDRVFSSLALHHLDREQKARAIAECRRVLVQEGRLHVADLGPARGFYSRLVTPIVGRHEEAADNVAGLLPEMFKAAGFIRVEETAHFTTVFGTVCLYRAIKPD